MIQSHRLLDLHLVQDQPGIIHSGAVAL